MVVRPLEAPEFSSADLTRDLFTLSGSQDLCDKSWIWQQYDYMVRTNTTLGPGCDAAIVRIKNTLQLDTIWVSDALAPVVAAHPDLDWAA